MVQASTTTARVGRAGGVWGERERLSWFNYTLENNKIGFTVGLIANID